MYLILFRQLLFLSFLLLRLPLSIRGQQQDPTTMNGGSVLAMAGKDCVALAVDKRFGSGMQLVNISPRHILAPTPNAIVAFTGLEGDVQSLKQELEAQIANKYNRGLGMSNQSPPNTNTISPRSLASLTSHILYNRRHSPYFAEPLVVGLEPKNSEKIVRKTPQRKAICCHPFLCSLDVIGARSQSSDFCCAGVATKSIYGTAEALWKPDLEADQLVEVCGKAFLSALERDSMSGYGAVVYLITASDGIIEYDLVTRND